MESLPAEMIQLIAVSLDAHSLAHLEGTDKFTRTSINSRSLSLWRPLADLHSHTNPQANAWLSEPARYKLRKFSQSPLMADLKVSQPKQYIKERWKMVKEFHARKLRQYQMRIMVLPFKARVMKMRWYEELILPILLFVLLTIFLIVLVYELQSNAGRVTWLSMSFFLILCGLVALSTCNMCFIRVRSYRSPAWLQKASYELEDEPETLRSLYEYDRDYDTLHYIPDDYIKASYSFVDGVAWRIEFEPGPSRREYIPSTFGVRREYQLNRNRKKLFRCALAAVIFTGLLLSIIVRLTCDKYCCMVLVKRIRSLLRVRLPHLSLSISPDVGAIILTFRDRCDLGSLLTVCHIYCDDDSVSE